MDPILKVLYEGNERKELPGMGWDRRDCKRHESLSLVYPVDLESSNSVPSSPHQFWTAYLSELI